MLFSHVHFRTERRASENCWTYCSLELDRPAIKHHQTPIPASHHGLYWSNDRRVRRVHLWKLLLDLQEHNALLNPITTAGVTVERLILLSSIYTSVAKQYNISWFYQSYNVVFCGFVQKKTNGFIYSKAIFRIYFNVVYSYTWYMFPKRYLKFCDCYLLAARWCPEAILWYITWKS